MSFLKTNKVIGSRPLVMLLPLLAIAVSGCSSLTGAPPPVIKKELAKDVVTLSAKAERRFIVASTSDDKNLRVCAEPSPDVAEAISAAVRAGIEASGSSGSVTDAKAKAEIAQSVATSVAALTKRSQGLQYLRDGTYAICQGAMSGAVKGNRNAILKFYKKLLENSKQLIMAEINTPGWNADVDIKVTAPKLSDLATASLSN